MRQYNCKNCGAPIEHTYNHKCPYCNSIFDFNEPEENIIEENLVEEFLEEEQKKNDILADIVVRMRTDSDFLSVVESLHNLDHEKLVGVKQMLAAFQK